MTDETMRAELGAKTLRGQIRRARLTETRLDAIMDDVPAGPGCIGRLYAKLFSIGYQGGIDAERTRCAAIARAHGAEDVAAEIEQPN